MSEPARKKLRTRLYCEHCDDYVSKTTYYAHKRHLLDTKDALCGSESDGYNHFPTEGLIGID